VKTPCFVRDYDRLFRGLLAKRKGKGRTCDGLKWGKLDKPVARVAVAWMATLNVIRQAVSQGCDLIIHHEPLFYDHWDRDPRKKSALPAKRKKDLLKRNGITVYRVHDAWDFFPEYGVLDS
jgi:putative NIF3 family GTP cyclohydrolase 1 type 2